MKILLYDRFGGKTVVVHGPYTFDNTVEFGSDVEIGSFCVIKEGVVIGNNCRIGEFSIIDVQARVKDNSIIPPYSHIKRKIR